jgi:hypothetical protein
MLSIAQSMMEDGNSMKSNGQSMIDAGSSMMGGSGTPNPWSILVFVIDFPLLSIVLFTIWLANRSKIKKRNGQSNGIKNWKNWAKKIAAKEWPVLAIDLALHGYLIVEKKFLK